LERREAYPCRKDRGAQQAPCVVTAGAHAQHADAALQGHV
jgi:hypothetical protein